MTFRSSPALQTVCGTSAFGCRWPSEGRRSKLHSSSGCGGQLSPIFWSHRAAGGWLWGMRSSLQQQSLLAKQPRSPAELRTDRMLPPSYFKAKDDIPRIRLSPGPRHHNRHFDYLLCHIIFHWRHSCQKKKKSHKFEPHPRDKFIVIDCCCKWRCRKLLLRNLSWGEKRKTE